MMLVVRRKEGELVVKAQEKANTGLATRNGKVGKRRDPFRIWSYPLIRDDTSSKAQAGCNLKLAAGEGYMGVPASLEHGMKTFCKFLKVSDPN